MSQYPNFLDVSDIALFKGSVAVGSAHLSDHVKMLECEMSRNGYRLVLSDSKCPFCLFIVVSDSVVRTPIFDIVIRVIHER